MKTDYTVVVLGGWVLVLLRPSVAVGLALLSSFCPPLLLSSVSLCCRILDPVRGSQRNKQSRDRSSLRQNCRFCFLAHQPVLSCPISVHLHHAFFTKRSYKKVESDACGKRSGLMCGTSRDKPDDHGSQCLDAYGFAQGFWPSRFFIDAALLGLWCGAMTSYSLGLVLRWK